MRRYSRWFCLVAALLLITTALFAAGQKEEKEDGKIVIGYATRELTAAFSRAAMLGAQSKAKELGIELIVVSSDNDTLRHLAVMDDFITQGIDGFIHAGVLDTQAVVPAIKKMNDEGIPVTALDNCPDGGMVEYFLSFNKRKSSAKATEAMLEEMKKKHDGQIPNGVVIEVMGDLQANFALECTAGFNSVISKYPQLKVVQGSGNWNNDDAFTVVSDFLTRFGEEVVGVYVHTPDIMGIGAVNAIKQAGYDPKDFASGGICMGPEGRDLIMKGEFSAIVGQPIFVSGEMCVELLYKIITGQPVPKAGDTIIEDGAIWSPAEVMVNPEKAEGLYIELNAPLVPQVVSADDPRLWENRVSQ